MLTEKWIQRLCFLLGALSMTVVIFSWNWLHEKHEEWIQMRCQNPQESSTNLNRPSTQIDTVIDDHQLFEERFRVNIPEEMPMFSQDSQDYFLIVFVSSRARGEKYRERRDMIRKTWGSHNTCEQQKVTRNVKLAKFKWLLIFVLAKAGPDDDKRNKEEAKKYNDMLIFGHISDAYFKNTMKFYTAQLWAASSLTTFNYTLQVDDDAYMRIPKIIEYLSDVGLPKYFYGGNLVSHTKRSFQRLSRRDIAPTFILLSTDLLPFLFGYDREPFPFEHVHAYMAAVLGGAKVAITKPIWSSSFYITPIMKDVVKINDCDILRLVGVVHNNADTDSCKILHNRTETMCTKDMTPSTTCRNSSGK